MSPLTQPPGAPTGPVHSFHALPYPLPPGAQARLQTLSAAVTAAAANHKSEIQDAASARRLLADYIGRLRETIGEELIRREFLPSQPSQ